MSAAPRRDWFNLETVFVATGLWCAMTAAGGQDTNRWWPAQTLPKAVVRIANPPESPAANAALQMLIQSVAGLAAKSVNQGRGDELVWVETGNPNLTEWFARWRAAHPEVNDAGAFNAGELLDRYSKRGIIKGYILYRPDKSPRDYEVPRSAMNVSVNVATSLAGVLDGIIVAEELEPEAKAHGLKLLLDVRDKTQSWCFQTYRNQFNHRMLCTQDPRKPHVRDLAIAHRVFTLYGQEEPIRMAMEWLEPLSPILGCNSGDEFENTDLSTRYGHIQTATDWCMNLPVLMAGSDRRKPPGLKGLDPATIDWADRRSAVSFIDTDGDNVQWLQGNFFLNNANYWGSPERGRIPFGWSCCFAQLTQLCPSAIDYALATRSANDFFVEWGGGYYYPDRFGLNRTNRWELLARHAGRTWELMKRTNSRVIGFNVARCDSADARKAYEVIASRTDGLLAIFAFQYDAYETGGGRVFWVKDRNGIEVPVITARYSIWEHLNRRDRAGTPAKVAREIRQTMEKTPRAQPSRYDWVIVHAWSYFRKAPGADESAEDMPQENASTRGGVRGYLPAVWCAERLPSSIRVVSPEELIWRVRMEHNAAQTKQFMSQYE